MLIRAVLGAIFSAIICTLGVNTFGLWYFYYPNTNYWAFTVSRFTQLTSVSANIILFAATIPVLSNMGLLPPLKENPPAKKMTPKKTSARKMTQTLIPIKTPKANNRFNTQNRVIHTAHKKNRAAAF